MDDQASFGDRRRLETCDADADEHEPIGLHALREARLRRAEREAREDHAFRCERFGHGVEILELAAAFVVHALRFRRPAEVRTPGLVAELDEGARQGLHHLVVERAAEERVRVRDERDAAPRCLRLINRAFDAAGEADDELAPGTGRIYIRNRSTMRPFNRCSSMISSISA